MNKIENKQNLTLGFLTNKEQACYEEYKRRYTNRLKPALYALIYSANSSSDFGHIYKRMEIIIEKWGKNLVEMAEYFGCEYGCKEGFCTECFSEIWTEGLDPIFVEHTAKLMIGRRRQLLELAEKAEGSAQIILKVALQCHLQNISEMDIAHTALWRLTSNGKTVANLYPVVHMTPKTIRNHPEFFRKAIDECDCVAMEYLWSSIERRRQIRELLSQTFCKKTWLECEEFSEANLSYLKTEMKNEDVVSELGFKTICSCLTENTIMQDIHSKTGKKVQVFNLETEVAHGLRLLLLQILSSHRKLKMEASGLFNFQEKAIITIEDWQLGDIEKITNDLWQSLVEAEPLVQEIAGQSIVKHMATSNYNMAEAIHRIIEGNHIPLVLTGVVHFGGPDGILRQLTKKGYGLERIN